MLLFPSFLYAFSASIDIFAVALAYGIKKVKINFSSNLLIALVSSLGTFASMGLGKSLANIISPKLANISGSVILILIGLWCILTSFFKKKNENSKKLLKCEELLDAPEKADLDKSGTIDIKESFTLAFALMLNNIGLGLAASITKLNIYFTSIITFLLSIIIIFLGYDIGKKMISTNFSKYSEYISGLIIIILGIFQFFA